MESHKFILFPTGDQNELGSMMSYSIFKLTRYCPAQVWISKNLNREKVRLTWTVLNLLKTNKQTNNHTRRCDECLFVQLEWQSLNFRLSYCQSKRLLTELPSLPNFEWDVNKTSSESAWSYLIYGRDNASGKSPLASEK